VDPNDTAYIPRPEWYFLFLFKFLALWGQIPLLGKIEWIATTVVPGAAVLALVVLPFLDRNPRRSYARRALALAVMGVVIADIVALTLIANIPTTGGSPMTVLQTVAGLGIPLVALLALFGLGAAYRPKPEVSVRVLPWIGGGAAVGILAVAGIVLAWLMYGRGPVRAETIGVATNPIHRLLLNKYYVDELYDALIVRPLFRVCQWCARAFDQAVIDGIVNGVAGAVMAWALGMRRIQTGFVMNYALGILIGAVAAVAYFLARG